MKRTALLILFILTTAGLRGQQEITIRIREGMPMIPVALPDIQYTAASLKDDSARDEIQKTLLADLDFSRIFKPLPRDYYRYLPPFNPQAINFKDWASVQANVLIAGELEISAPDRLVLSVKVYEVNGERFIFSRTFGGKKEFGRLIAHRVADEMMKHFSEKPIFTSKIVYVSGSENEQEIFMMDYDGARPTRLTFNTFIDMLPSWSRNNEKILFTSYRRLNPDLYLFDIYSGQSDIISAKGVNYAADWSPVEDKTVYTSSKEGNAEIYLRDMQSGAEKRLTFNPAIDTSPCWSPNGREIAFTSQRNGTPQIYIMDAEGSNVRRITFEGTYHDSSAWSPDGSRLAFVSRIDTRFDIYVYNLKRNEMSKLTENAGRNENPSWSPDGRHLAFTSNRGGRYQIYLIDYDGQNVKAITSGGENRMPKWQKSVK